MKVVINNCYGGFSLSHKAIMRYAELKGLTLYPFVNRLSKEVYEKVYGRTPTLEDALENKMTFVSYAFAPEEEVRKVEEEESEKPVVVGRYEKTNTLYFSDRDIKRDDPLLIQVVKELKKKANGDFAKLKVVNIPDGVEWEIEEYDGWEHIAEKHRTWH
jgi:hypothetical protein